MNPVGWVVPLAMLAACALSPPRVRRPLVPAITTPLVVADDAPFRRTPPAPLPVRPRPFPTIEHFTLANGMTVYVLPRPGDPSLAVRLVCRRCGEDDPVAPAGLAQLAIGTLVRTARADRMTSHGTVRITGAATDEMAQLSAWTRTGSLGDLVRALAQQVRRPRWDAAAFQDERNDLALDEGDVLVDLVRTAVFGMAHPYGRRLSAFLPALRASNPAFAEAFFALHFVPAETALVVVGDVTRAAVQAEAVAAFDDWPPTPVAPRPPFALIPLSPRVMFLDVRGTLLSRIMVALPGVASADRDYPAMVLLERLLGGIFDSRLNRSLRETLGLAYSSTSLTAAFHDAGILLLATQVSLRDAVPTAQALIAELRRVVHEPVSDAEIATVRAVARAGLRERFEGVDEATSAITELFVRGESVEAPTQLDARLQAVTPADLQRVAAAHLGVARMQIAMTGDRHVIGNEAARTLGTVEFIHVGD